jgi:hypothetical protein
VEPVRPLDDDGVIEMNNVLMISISGACVGGL